MTESPASYDLASGTAVRGDLRSADEAETWQPAAGTPLSRLRAWASRWGITPGVALSAVVLLLVLIAVVAPQALTSRDPLAPDYSAVLQPPSAHAWLGTDELGRDELARVVYGARYSLAIGVGATVLAIIIGVVLGTAAAMAGRAVDTLISRAADLLMAFPALLFALVVIALAGPGEVNLTLSIAFATCPLYLRLVRAKVTEIRQAEFVSSLALLGVGRFKLLVRHVLPNALLPLLVVATTGVGNSLVIGAGLSFLGLGASPPQPEWGLMLSDARDQLAHGWWLVLAPGAAITVVVISFTVLGRWCRAQVEGHV